MRSSGVKSESLRSIESLSGEYVAASASVERIE